MACGLYMGGLFAIRTAYLSINYYIQERIMRNRQVAVSSRLFKAYMTAPYAFHLKHNSSVVITNVEEEVERIMAFAEDYSVKMNDINGLLESLGTAPLVRGCKLMELIGRPQLTFENLSPALPCLHELLDSISDRQEEIIEEAEIQIKYKGYIMREVEQAQKMHRLEDIRIRGRFDYNTLQSISTEGRQKLIRHDPETLAQASRIPGVSPSDINVLLVLLGR